MKRLVFLLAVAMGVAAGINPAHAQSADERAVLQVVEDLFTAMKTRDVSLVERTMTTDAFVIAVDDDGMRQSSRDEFAEGIANWEVEVIERIWDPEVRVDGKIAQVWAPYDIYLGGAFSHCGFDAFHLVRVEGGWKMAGVTYSRAQPPICDLHPEGPPM